ncbi:MAG TPA: AI-2E family transporter [Xanthobacteraceae bacterium]|jgi:predicted PurR-regulated permease PerM
MNDQSAAEVNAQRSDSEPAERTALPIDAQARRVARATFTILLVSLAFWVARDFLPALAWAAVIALTIWPLYIRFRGLISEHRTPTLAPLLFTLLVATVIFVPLLLPLQKAAQESDTIIQWVTKLREQGVPAPHWLAGLPIAGNQAAEWWNANLANPEAASQWLSRVNMDNVTEWTRTFGGQLLHRLFLFFIMLLALFFLLRDGAWVAARVLDTADRLLGNPGERLVSKMVDAVRGTVTGTVVVALVEGALIGVAYVVAGVPSPFIFAFLTAAFAMLPFGAWIAFSTAALLLLIVGGSGLAAFGVFAFGAVVMFIGDHFVWPMLVGGAARLPFLLALIGIFGGLQVFGLLGLFVGPVIMAACLTVWRDWLAPRDGPVAGQQSPETAGKAR